MRRLIHQLGIVLPCILFTTICLAQPPTEDPQGSLEKLFDLINSKTRDFSFPNLDDTLLVGTIDLSQLSTADIGFTFHVPTYDSGKYAYPNENFQEEPLIPVKYGNSRGGVINLSNQLRVNLRFNIVNWTNSKTTKLTILLGNVAKTLNYGDSMALFLNVKTANPSLIIRAQGFTIDEALLKMNPAYYRGKQAKVWGLVPLKINRLTLAIGAINLQVIPLSIIYAPPVDLQKTNYASSSQTEGIGNSTTVSFNRENSVTGPYQTLFDDVKSTQEFLNTTAAIYSKIPMPVAQAIAKAADEISKALGSAEATQTLTNSNTTQHSSSVLLEKSMTVKTSAKDGGPGMGDLFVYFRNVKLMWRMENGDIYLTLLGADPIEQVSAAKLKEGLARLKNKPKGTKDNLLRIDVNSIMQLLKLDPLVKITGGATLKDTKRFRYLDSWHVTSGSNRQTYKYTLTTEDLKNFTYVTNNLERDQAGPLAALGLGVDRDALIQTKVSQSNTQKYSTMQQYAQEFNLNGEGFSVNNSVNVYFDIVFNAFVFEMTKLKSRP